MIVWRLCEAPYTALDGEGARLYGSRWNSPGLAVTFAATSLSLATLEYLVHVDRDLFPDNLVAMRIELPDDDYPRVTAAQLPALDDSEWFLERGDTWIRSRKSLVLVVPSVIIPEEDNVLVNPRHPDSRLVTVTSVRPLSLDSRLRGR